MKRCRPQLKPTASGLPDKLTALFSCVLIMAAFSCRGVETEKGPTASDVSVLSDSTATCVPQTAILYFVGDAMQHSPQISRARALGNGSYDYSDCFTLIEPYIRHADYAVVNLEVPLGGGKGGYTGYPCFSAPDDYAVALRDAGFDLFLTANNHTLDRLDYGLRRTISVLDSIGVDHIGTYRDRDERLKAVPFIKDIAGMRVGFLNYTYGTNGIAARQGAEVSLIDNNEIAREVELTRCSGAELLVVCLHWGEEYRLRETPSQQKLAKALLDMGVDIIIGSHPHVVEPMHLVDNEATGKKALIVYSLGNFISNQTDTNSRGGASVTCYISRDSTGRVQLTDAAYDLFFTAKPGGTLANYQVVPAFTPGKIPASQRHEFDAFTRTARKLFEKSNTGPVKEFNPNTL